MIADATFGAPVRGVRALRFIPCASIPVEAACLVANGLRETLRQVFGAACEVVVGEPAVLDPVGWSSIARDAHLFLTRGRQTDIVLVVSQCDARRMVLRAFGEADGSGGAADTAADAWSALELQAIERIAARCAAAFEPLCAERYAAPRPVDVREVRPCVAYVDVRVQAPVALTLGIGIVRDLPDPGPSGSLGASALDRVGVEACVVFAEGTMSAASFLALRPGDVVALATKVGGPASLNVAGRRLASGVAGVVASHRAFFVHDVALGAHS